MLNRGIGALRELAGPEPGDLIRIALWSCLERSPDAAILVGFTTPEQVRINLTGLRQCPERELLRQARAIMAQVQTQLDEVGEVFLDESGTVT